MRIEIKDGRLFFSVTLVVFLILVSIFFIIIPWIKAGKLYQEMEYHGVINKIEYRDGYRGVPHILIDSTWHLLTMDELKIEEHIKVGDSLAKEKGSEIKIYRKDAGKYVLESVY